jgi:recombinational DNA repair protein RecT
MSNKLQLTLAVLDSAKSLKELVEIPAVRGNAIVNLMKARGLSEKEAAMYYEREKILFSQVKNIDKCENFSKYAAWIQLFVSGRTLSDGDSYIIAYGKQAQFQIGWKGRLAQMGEIPEIINIPPPQVVYDGDDFKMELGETPRIITHIPAKINRGQLAYVYLIIQKKSGKELHYMDRERVLGIRDRYSKSYQQYIADCKALKQEVGSTFKKNMGSYDITVEPPMWVSSEEEAWKKTLVKQAYKSQQNKTPRMKSIDRAIENNAEEEEIQDINYGIVDEAKQIETKEPEPSKQDQPDLGNLNEAF